MNFLLRLHSNVHKALAFAGTTMLFTGSDIQRKTEHRFSVWNLFRLNCFFSWKESEKGIYFVYILHASFCHYPIVM